MHRNPRTGLLVQLPSCMGLTWIADAEHAASIIVALRGSLILVPGRFDKGRADAVDLAVGVDVRDGYLIRRNKHNGSISLMELVDVESSIPG